MAIKAFHKISSYSLPCSVDLYLRFHGSVCMCVLRRLVNHGSAVHWSTTKAISQCFAIAPLSQNMLCKYICAFGNAASNPEMPDSYLLFSYISFICVRHTIRSYATSHPHTHTRNPLLSRRNAKYALLA